ncbi:MAG: hypothetical protein KDK70_08850 [Myxococcales bacterium]|nr:hypothetical protein [Myxococcales bacterium]
MVASAPPAHAWLVGEEDIECAPEAVIPLLFEHGNVVSLTIEGTTSGFIGPHGPLRPGQLPGETWFTGSNGDRINAQVGPSGAGVMVMVDGSSWDDFQSGVHLPTSVVNIKLIDDEGEWYVSGGYYLGHAPLPGGSDITVGLQPNAEMPQQ